MEHIAFLKKKLIFPQLVRKFPHFMGFDYHYPVHKSPLFFSALSQFISPQIYPISYRSILILFSHLQVGLPKWCLSFRMIVFFTNLMHKFFILIHLLHSSTFFEQYYAHLQEDNCINTASGIVTVFR